MEFQAVVMAAGKGSRMTDLTARKPKCLLPIGNLPMLWYPLHALQLAGFHDAIVVVPENTRNDMENFSIKYGLTIQLDVCPIPNHEDCGTADSLRHVQDKLKKDVNDILIVGCDLVTDMRLHKLFDLHRIHEASVTALLAEIPCELAAAPVPGPRTKHKPDRDLIGVDESVSRLLLLTSEADFDELVSVKQSVLVRHPRLSLHTELLDAHLYLLKRWVVDFILEEKSYSTLKGEVIPKIVKSQFCRQRHQGETADDSVSSPRNQKRDAELEADQIRRLSCWNDHHGDLDGPYHGDRIRCFCLIQKAADGGVCLRANNLGTYCELNRQMPTLWSSLAPNVDRQFVDSNAQVISRQVGNDCLVGAGTQILGKTTVKRSVIGQHCRISEKVKITNCIIMDHATVREGCNLQGTILCDGVTVDEMCDLKDCLVGSNQNVHSGVKSTNEVIVDMDRLMEI